MYVRSIDMESALVLRAVLALTDDGVKEEENALAVAANAAKRAATFIMMVWRR